MKTLFRSIGLTMLCAVVALAWIVPGPAMAYDEKNPLVLKVSVDNPPADMKAVTVKRLCDLVQEKTNGRVQFKYFFGGTLTKKPQFIDAVARGIADISTGPISFVTGKLPELSVFEIYGAYKLEQTNEMQVKVMPALTDYFKPHGIHPLLIQYSGSVVFADKTKFLNLPSDWQGQKIRLGGRWQSALGQKWGASPVFLPPADLYTALQRGVIDGYMLVWDIIYGLKLFEVAPYHVDTNFSNNIEVVDMNLKKWDELTQTDKDIFNEAIKEVMPWTLTETLKAYAKIRENIEAQGGKVHTLTPEERSAYLKDAATLYPEVEKVGGEWGAKFIDLLKEFQDK